MTAKTATPLPPDELTLRDLADELGEKLALADLFQAETGDRLKELKDEMRTRFEVYPADQTAVVRGSRYLIELGVKKNERTIISLPAVRRKLKMKIGDFLEFCGMTLKVFDRVVPEDRQAGLISEERSGPRSIKAVDLS